jgi:hypothetical protein
MVDITNPSFIPSYEPLDLQQQQQTVEQTETQDASGSFSAPAPEAEETSSGGVTILSKLGKNEDEAITDEEKRKSKEKDKGQTEANLTSRYLKPRRSFNTNSLKDQLSQRLQQSKPQDQAGKTTNQPADQTSQTSQNIGMSEQPDMMMADGFAQLPKTDKGQQTSDSKDGFKGNLAGYSQTPTADSVFRGQGQSPKQNPLAQASQGVIRDGQGLTNTFGLQRNTQGGQSNPNISSDGKTPGQDQFSSGIQKGTPRQFPSPLGTNINQLASSLTSSMLSSQLGTKPSTTTPSIPTTANNAGQADSSSTMPKSPVFGRPAGLSSQGLQSPLTSQFPSSSPNPLGVPTEKGGVGKTTSQDTDALSQANAKGAFGAIVNKPVSMFEDKASYSQTSLATNDKEQVKMALATKFPTFTTLPPNIQNSIAEVFVSQPDLPLETAETFIQFAETNSFQKLGANDKTLALKVLGSLMQNPMSGANDGRMAQVLNDVASGMMDLQIYRSPSNEPGRSDSTGVALNLGSPEVADAVNQAMKGDSSKLANIFLNLVKVVPNVQAQDPTWQTLMSQPDFKDLQVGKQEIFQTMKQFPEANAKQLIEYAAFPSAKFVSASSTDKTNELKLVASVNTLKEGETKDVSGETGQPARTTGSGLRLPGLSAGRLDTTPGTTQQLPLDELVQEATINIGLYRANDGKKNVVEENNIKLNIADPSVQRSLATDGKLAGAAATRMTAVAAKSVDQAINELNNNPAFKKLDEKTKRLLASALKEHPKADVEQLLKFAQSDSYTEIPPDKSSREKGHLMRMVASLLHQFADNPKQLMMLYNSLQRMFNNDIKFDGFLNDSKYISNNQGGGVSINSKWVENEREAAAVFVTEVNHALHERPNMNWGGTIAFFANQYRSAYTEALFRTNAQPEPEQMRQFITGLLSPQPSSVYVHLYNTYQTDPVFTNLVKWIEDKLNDDEVVKPEELRQTLLGMVGKSPNIESEEPFQDSWFIDNESPFPDAAAVVAQVSSQVALDQLSTKEQAVVINLVRKYEADPAIFHELMQTPRFQQADEAEKTWLLRLIGGLSSEASKEGKGSPAQRTLAQVLGGKVDIKFYENQTDPRLQHLEKNVLNINLHEAQNLLVDDWVAGFNDAAIDSILGTRK